MLVCYGLLGPMLAVALAATEAEPAAATDNAAALATEVVRGLTTEAVREETSKAVPEEARENATETATADVADEEAKKLCDISMIDEVFKDYEKAVGSEQISKIQRQLKIGGYDPREVDGRTGPNTDAAFARFCADYKVDKYFEAKEYTDPDEARSRLAGHLVKLLSNPATDLNGGDCGCSRDFLSGVYGLYPYLLGGAETQEVDFSLLDWIGFHALVLDEAGEIEDDLQWRSDNGKIEGFIREAHKYRVQVDVTFYAPGWEAWDYRATGKAAKTIAAIVNQQFHGSNPSLWSRIVQRLEGASKVSADGVNLYIDYNVKPGSSKKLTEIVTRVFEELEETGSAAKLNLMLRLKLSDIDKRQLADLKSILVGDAAPVDKVLIFLPKNTPESRKSSSRSKKALRQTVENAFSGNNRITVLRKIVPIITPVVNDFEPLPESDEGDSQFDDDLVYFKDNFAGVGLWPLPLKSGSSAEQIGTALIKHYRARDGFNYLGEKLEDYAPQVCSFVCPNRLVVYIVIGLLAGILAVCLVLILLNCRLRNIFQRYFLIFVVLFISILLILVLSLVCDPFWERYVDGVVIGILLLFIAGFVWGSFRKAIRPKLP